MTDWFRFTHERRLFQQPGEIVLQAQLPPDDAGRRTVA